MELGRKGGEQSGIPKGLSAMDPVKAQEVRKKAAEARSKKAAAKKKATRKAR